MERLSDDDLRTLGLRTVVGGPGGGDRPSPRRAGAGLPPGGGAVLLRGAAEGGVRHRDPGPRHQHAGPDRGGGAVRQVPGLGHLGPHLGRVPAADRAGRPAGDRHRGPCLRPVVARPRPSPWWPAPPSAPPPDLVSSFHPTYNLAVNLVRRWSEEEAHALLAASYGQWQAPAGSESLAAQLDRRLAILEDRGFIDGWRITEAGTHAGLDLPRVGPAGGRGPPSRAVRRAGPGPAGRGGLRPHLRGPADRATTIAPRRQVGWSSGWPGWTALAAGTSGPTSAGSDCGGPGGPTPAWPGR